MSMKKEGDSIVYIDGANLHKGVESSGWKLDYKKFRPWLGQKFNVTDAYIFIGLIPKYANLYTMLQSREYKLIFKEVIYDGAGRAKGNCDVDLVLAVLQDYYERKVSKVVLVSSDGDYAPLVMFLLEKSIDCRIVSPAPTKKCSILLKRTGARIVYLEDVKHKLMLQK